MFAMFLPPINLRKLFVVSTLLWIFVYAILLIANVAPFKDSCPWQFPKIISCALGVRENLAGGLIAAAGALFAAWLAWSAVREQIEQERHRELRTRGQQLEVQRENAENEVTALLPYGDRLDQLISLLDIDREKLAYPAAMGLRHADAVGAPNTILGPIPRDPAGVTVQNLLADLKAMAASIEQRTQIYEEQSSGSIFKRVKEELEVLNETSKRRKDDLLGARNLIQDAIERHRTKARQLDAQVAVLSQVGD
jgi:hypothetical protein